jgi:hypothetical protein
MQSSDASTPVSSMSTKENFLLDLSWYGLTLVSHKANSTGSDTYFGQVERRY